MLLKKNIPFKYVFGKIKYEIIVITVYTLLIAVAYNQYHSIRITIPLAIPAVLGTVISLLLGFRSNQAYDRWWEARHIWGAIVNDSRTLARQIMSFTYNSYNDKEVSAFRERMIRRQIAWNFSLGNHLRNEDTRQVLQKYLGKDEIEKISDIEHVPSALSDQMGADIRHALEQGWINSYQQIEIDRTLSRLCDSMGKCERIKNTVFPSTYSLYIHLSLMLFIGLLPFGVIEYFGFVEIPLVVAISACFLLIEKMAIHLQDPFENKPTDTPVTSIAAGIEKNLLQLYGMQSLVKPGRSIAAAQVKGHAGKNEALLEFESKEVYDDGLLSYFKHSSNKTYFIL